MLTEGAPSVGCHYFAGYPITLASEVYEAVMRELCALTGLTLSTPDEIADPHPKVHKE